MLSDLLGGLRDDTESINCMALAMLWQTVTKLPRMAVVGHRPMKRAALASGFIALIQPVQAQPSLQTFNRDDTGIMGCQGQASSRGAQAWGKRVYATWALGEGTVVMANGQGLRSYAYERSDAGGRSFMRWQIPSYRVEFTFAAKSTGYETSGGNGAFRVFSVTAGDSVSIPVRVDEGC